MRKIMFAMLAAVLMLTSCIGYERVDAGYEGIKVNLYGDGKDVGDVSLVKALIKAGRKDLIGTGANCLVPPDKNAKPTTDKGKQNRHNKTKKVSHQWQGPKGKSGKKR